MKATLDINDVLLEQVREEAGKRRRPLNRVLEELLQLGLGQSEKAASTTGYQVKPHPLGLKPAFRGQSLNQLYDQLEAEDAAR